MVQLPESCPECGADVNYAVKEPTPDALGNTQGPVGRTTREKADTFICPECNAEGTADDYITGDEKERIRRQDAERNMQNSN